MQSLIRGVVKKSKLLFIYNVLFNNLLIDILMAAYCYFKRLSAFIRRKYQS